MEKPKKVYPNTLVGFFNEVENLQVSEDTQHDVKQAAGAYVTGIISRNRFSRIAKKAVGEGADKKLLNAMTIWMDNADSVTQAYGDVVKAQVHIQATIEDMLTVCAQKHGADPEDLITLWEMNLLANFMPWACAPKGVRRVATVANKSRTNQRSDEQ